MEVRDEVVAYKNRDTCNVSPTSGQIELFTVSDLFKRIASYQPSCGKNGCACDGPIDLDITYHPQHGYPQMLAYRLRPDLRWQYPEYWQAVISRQLQQCPPSTYLGETIEVQSLTPLDAQPADQQPPITTPDKPTSSSIADIMKLTPTPTPP
jgi:hypothetical protein